MLGEIPRWRCSLREFQSCLSTLTDSFLFRERLRPAPSRFLHPRDLWGKNNGAEDSSGQWQASSRHLTTKWMTAFLWRLQMQRSYRALWLTPPSCCHLLHATPDSERMRSSSASWQKLSTSSGSNGLRLRSHLAAGWTSGFSRGAIRPSAKARPPSSPKFMKSSRNRGTPPTHLASVLLLPLLSHQLTAKGYERLPPLVESVATHLCPPTAIGLKGRASHPSKPCRATSALAGCAYSATGQTASALPLYGCAPGLLFFY